jgi:VIT1/CCC1 family predicted Fe2+/Mn2+ transporter
MAARHREKHRTSRMGWLRAAVLGANDGIISTGSLILGVAASGANRSSVLIAGFSALIAGAMSMAAGEYVSVHSQADSEQAELDVEKREIKEDPHSEQVELEGIYVRRGLDPALAKQVATQLMEKDALKAHARDELGITDTMSARPLQASLASAVSFTGGAALPLLACFFAPHRYLIEAVAAACLFFLALLGSVAAYTGGAPMRPSVMRVTFWGALALAVTAAVGHIASLYGA